MDHDLADLPLGCFQNLGDGYAANVVFIVHRAPNLLPASEGGSANLLCAPCARGLLEDLQERKHAIPRPRNESGIEADDVQVSPPSSIITVAPYTPVNPAEVTRQRLKNPSWGTNPITFVKASRELSVV